MYYSCHCIKRNGLQHDCRRTGCGGEPTCLHLPDPLCAPSQLARARGLADPGPLAAHINAQSGGGSGGGGGAGGSALSGGGSGKRFIVCELKGISPEINADRPEKCCKCPAPVKNSPQVTRDGNVGACILANVPTTSKPTVPSNTDRKCPCRCDATSNQQGTIVLDDKTINQILSSFSSAKEGNLVTTVGPGGRPRKPTKPVVKEPCTRPGCVHWQPPPPCCWDGPCKADCFETPPGIQPGRKPLTGGGSGGGNFASGSGQGGSQGLKQSQQRIQFMTPQCCTGCSAPGGGATTAAAGGIGGPAAGMPVLVMKLC